MFFKFDRDCSGTLERQETYNCIHKNMDRGREESLEDIACVCLVNQDEIS